MDKIRMLTLFLHFFPVFLLYIDSVLFGFPYSCENKSFCVYMYVCVCTHVFIHKYVWVFVPLDTGI